MNPFTGDPTRTVASCGESGLLRRLPLWLDQAMPAGPFGMGDDASVLPGDGPRWNLVAADSLVYGRHFDANATPEQAGRKLLCRNLSDIAAMGGVPAGAVVALIIPARTSLIWLERFHRGLAEAALRYQVPITGGDLAESHEDLSATLTIWGHAERPILRQGGQRSGDSIWVTGALGGSGLRRHLSFEPRLCEGRWLAGEATVCAMIDLSDGLAKDLPTLLPEGLGARLDCGAIPVHPDAREASALSGRSDLAHALGDGEDHELLFVQRSGGSETPECFRQRFMAALGTPVSRIGFLSGDGPPGKAIDSRSGDLLTEDETGYQHYRGT